MNSEDLQQYIRFAKDLAKDAGVIQRRYFNASDIETVDKENDTPVTVADLKINQLVIDRVKETFPDHGILGEEGSYEPSRDHLWVCDPIDGTFPYSHGIPVFTFSLALVYKGVSIVAVVYDPIVDRLAWASEGGGAWLNDKKLELEPEYPKAGMRGIEVEVWGDNDGATFDDNELSFKIERSLAEAGFMNMFHCSIVYPGLLCASGSLIGFVFAGSNPWDVAAISLIISEAGGVVSDCFGNRDNLHYNGKVKGLIVARNEVEHKELCNAVVPLFKASKLRST